MIIVAGTLLLAVLFFGLGTAFLPGHAAWDTLLLWASAIVGSLVAYYVSCWGFFSPLDCCCKLGRRGVQA